jgi:hypothetical protein
MANDHEHEMIVYDSVFVEVNLPGVTGFSIPVCRPSSGRVMINLASAMRSNLTRDFELERDNYLINQGDYSGALPPGYWIHNGELVIDPAGWTSSDDQWYDVHELADWFSSRRSETMILSEECKLVLRFIEKAAEVSLE